MFQVILADVQAQKEALRVQAGHLEASAAAAAATFATNLVEDLNDEARQVYETQKVLEHESQLLKQELASLTQQLSTWSSKTQALLEALKHVGDIEHYTAVLQGETAALVKVLTTAAQQQMPQQQQAAKPRSDQS